MKYLLIFLMCMRVCWVASAEEVGKKDGARKDSMNRDYWLYLPKSLDPKKTYWLVVGVHGHLGKGDGAAGLKSWTTKFDNVIVVGPTFPSNNPYYQMLEGDSDAQLLLLHRDLSKEFKLHQQMFLYGFSGGAQYVHRFASRYPEAVIGVSANSGGTWDNEPSPKAKFPWVVSCGLKDLKHSTASAPGSRIDCFRAFYQAINNGNFTVKPLVTDAGHSTAPEMVLATEECFRVSSSGLFDYQREAVKTMNPTDREAWILKDTDLQDKEFNDGKTVHKLKVNKDGWTVDRQTLAGMKNTRLLLDKLKETP